MTLDHWLVLNINGPVLCLMIMAAALASSIVATVIIHRFIPHHKLKVHNDIAGPIFGTLGVVYAVLLAFVIVIIWQRFDRVKTNTETEVYCLADLSADAESFEPSFRQRVRSQIKAYTNEIISEWDMFAKGTINAEAGAALEKLGKLYSSYSPRNETDKVFFQESVSEVNRLLNLRILRLTEGRSGVQPLLWIVLIAGGIITIAFTIFFGSESLPTKILMTAFLTVLIALILFTILDFSFPFIGSAVVSAEPFKRLLMSL